MAVNRNRTASGVGTIAAFLLILVLVLILVFGKDVLREVSPGWWGLLPIFVALAVIVATTGRWNPLVLAVGADGRLSLSKFQTLVWTLVVLYGYAALYAHDLSFPQPAVTSNTTTTVTTPPASPPAPTVSAVPGTTTSTTTTTTVGIALPAPVPAPAATPTPGAVAPIQFPPTLLLLLGFSVTTLVGAAGITTSQLARGAISKKPLPESLSLNWLVVDDNGRIDLTRFQMLMWTLVAAGVFLSDVWFFTGQPVYEGWLPDVGSALVLLMGFGHAAYLGGKLIVTPGKPLIYRLVPAAGATGDKIAIVGAGFGQPAKTSSVLMNGLALRVADADWTDTSVGFTVPALMPPDNKPWPAQPTQGYVTIAVGPLQSEAEALTVRP